MRMRTYRLMVCGKGFRRVALRHSAPPLRVYALPIIDRTKRYWSEIAPVSYAFMGWTDDQAAEPWRLQGSGTFCYAGIHAVRRAAMTYLAESRVDSISVRTNQDRAVYRYIKQADGRITGHSCDRE